MTKVDEQLVRLGGWVAERAADEAPGVAAVHRRLLEQLEDPGVERDIARLGFVTRQIKEIEETVDLAHLP